MVPESTLKELETACIAATDCLNRIVIVKAKIESLWGEVTPALLAETIKEPTCKLLESWRELNVALKPHVHRDFMAVCKEPVEIGEVVLAESAHSAAFWLSHHALVSLSIVLMPAGYWPSSEDPETDCFLVDFRSETPIDVSENAVRALRTVFDQLSLKELRKCIVVVYRECAAARSQLPPTAMPLKAVRAGSTNSDPNKRELNQLKDKFEMTESASHSNPNSLIGFLGGAELADALGIHATQRDAFFQHLMRNRLSLGDDCWHEVRNPRANSPRFLYRVDSPKLRGLATRYKTQKPT